MKTLFVNSIAGEHYELSPEQREWVQKHTKRKIQGSCVVLQGFDPAKQPTRQYRVEIHLVNGVLEPKLVLGEIETGDALICVGYEGSLNEAAATMQVRMSFKVFCELNEATILRRKRENPEQFQTSPSGEVKEKKTKKASERDAVLDALIELL